MGGACVCGTIRGRYRRPGAGVAGQDRYPGLAMSRSLGDTVAHSVGVSSVPEIVSSDSYFYAEGGKSAQLRHSLDLYSGNQDNWATAQMSGLGIRWPLGIYHKCRNAQGGRSAQRTQSRMRSTCQRSLQAMDGGRAKTILHFDPSTLEIPSTRLRLHWICPPAPTLRRPRPQFHSKITAELETSKLGDTSWTPWTVTP